MAKRCKRSLSIVLLGLLLLPAFTYAVDMEVGPYVQFDGPHTAVVRWDTSAAESSKVEYGLSPGNLDKQVTIATATTVHEVTLDDIDIKAKYFYRVGNGTDFTDVFWFDNSINYSRPDVSAATSPYTSNTLYATAADHIVSETGITKGFCLVYGSGEGRLAFELAKRTDLIIVGVETDPVKVQTSRQKLMQAGVYGANVNIQQVSDLSTLDITKYFANLIVSEHMITEGATVGSAAEMFRVLRPAGGVAFLGQPSGAPSTLTQGELETWLDAGSVTYTTTNDSNGVWSKVDRGDLPGAGWWSHIYGNAGNDGSSEDNLEGATSKSQTQLQWIGWPCGDSKVDRNPRGQTVVALDGRMVFRGFNRLIVSDSYNGAIYWSVDFADIKRFNVLRDAGWFCIDSDSVYVAVDDDCIRFNRDTGARTTTHQLNDPGLDWGGVFRYEDKLYGTAVIENSFYTGWWGSQFWYDSGYTDKICSKYIFANNSNGTRAWTYDSADVDKGVIIDSTICFGGGRIYFVESRSSAAESDADGQIGSALWGADTYLIGLDAATGAKLWQQSLSSIAIGDITTFMMYETDPSDPAKGVVLLSTTGSNFNLYAYTVNDASITNRWNHTFTISSPGHGGNKKRPLIMGDRVYFEKYCYNLDDGSLVWTDGPWANCGTYAGAAQTIFYRAGQIGMYDINTKSTSTWANIRPNCWLSIIGSGGMVLAPEGGGGCDCDAGWFFTSVGFTKAD